MVVIIFNIFLVDRLIYKIIKETVYIERKKYPCQNRNKKISKEEKITVCRKIGYC
jgi:hypothetical protein